MFIKTLLLSITIFSSTDSYDTDPLYYNHLLELKCESFTGRSLFYESNCYLIIDVEQERCKEVMPAFEIAERNITDENLKELRLLRKNESTFTERGKHFLNYKEQLCILTKILHCPPDVELVGTKCFYLNKEAKTHGEAMQDCEYKTMKMFYPHSDKDIKIVIDLTANSGLDEIWLSAVRENSREWEMNEEESAMFDYARWFDTTFLTSSTEKLNTKLSILSNVNTPIGYMSVIEKSSDIRLPSVCYSNASFEPIIIETTPATTTIVTTTTTQIACDENAQHTSTGCECNEGFTDILDTTIPDRTLYEMRGLKCIAGDPCQIVSDTLSIIFVIDSSGSIGRKGWDSLLRFVETAGPLLPKNRRFGFVKFSQDVTAKLWLRNGFTSDDFINGIPRKFDSSLTDTPGGLLAAAQMLQSDSNPRQTVVLFTDGVPYQPYKYSQDPGLKNAMRNSLNQLNNVNLLTVGFGPSMASSRATMESWLKNPKEDYFAYHQQTELFTHDYMKNILSRVCQL